MCSLLLVDDDEELLQIFNRRFTRRGYAVTAVCHPQAAVEAVRNQEFDLAIVDRSLPEQDGLELMQCLRRLDPGLPVIVLSGHSGADSESEAIHLGAFAYLTKPCRLDELEATVQKARQSRVVCEELV